MRVETCIGTIINVYRYIKRQYKNEEFISQFEKLKRLREKVDRQGVLEFDILMVEKATNELLYEFRALFENGGRRRFYSDTVH